MLLEKAHNIGTYALYDWRIFAVGGLNFGIHNTGTSMHTHNLIKGRVSFQPPLNEVGHDGEYTMQIIGRHKCLSEREKYGEQPPFFYAVEQLGKPEGGMIVVNFHQPAYRTTQYYRRTPQMAEQGWWIFKKTREIGVQDTLVREENEEIESNELLEKSDVKEPIFVNEVALLLPKDFLPSPLPHPQLVPDRYLSAEIYMPESIDNDTKSYSPQDMTDLVVRLAVGPYLGRVNSLFGLRDIMRASRTSREIPRYIKDSLDRLGDKPFDLGEFILSPTTDEFLSREKAERFYSFLKELPLHTYDFPTNKAVALR